MQNRQQKMKILLQENQFIFPSFGVDRILYSIYEQNFWLRDEDHNRNVLSLPQCLSPYPIALFKLSKNSVKFFTDSSSTNIGKKYVRSDEMGIKYAITIDFDTVKDKKVTIRERDTMEQIRVPIDNLLTKINNLN